MATMKNVILQIGPDLGIEHTAAHRGLGAYAPLAQKSEEKLYKPSNNKKTAPPCLNLSLMYDTPAKSEVHATATNLGSYYVAVKPKINANSEPLNKAFSTENIVTFGYRYTLIDDQSGIINVNSNIVKSEWKPV